MALGMEVGLGPGHIVLDGEPAPLPQKGRVLDGASTPLPQKGCRPPIFGPFYCRQTGTAPNFCQMSVVAKRLDR